MKKPSSEGGSAAKLSLLYEKKEEKA